MIAVTALGRDLEQTESMKLLDRLTKSDQACDHIPASMPNAQADACQECGSRYNLRMCATCGHVGCCESQAGDARRHAQAEGHPVIHQMPVPHGFSWCYDDRRYVG